MKLWTSAQKALSPGQGAQPAATGVIIAGLLREHALIEINAVAVLRICAPSPCTGRNSKSAPVMLLTAVP